MKEYTLKEIQNSLLNIINDFDKFCNENGIIYYLMGGSALGAIRHKGFIPWDDDIDVFMTYDNYHKFLDLAEQKINKEKYFLQRENTEQWPLFLSQIRLNNTTFISDDFCHNKKMHHGLFIDIMCLYPAPKNKFLRFIQYCAAMALKTRALYDSNYVAKSGLKRIIIKSSNFFVNKTTKKIFIKMVCRYNDKKVINYAHYFGRARFKYTTYSKSLFKKQKYVPFENIKLPVMDGVEEYLKIRYGKNWNNIPDKKTREKYPKHGGIVDLENDYSKYISKDEND